MRTVLETERLILRELDMSDLDTIAAMLMHPEVMRFWPRPYTYAESADWIKRQQQRYLRDGYGYWLSIDQENNQPIGQAGLMNSEVDGVIEPALGYITHQPFWHRGYAAEAAAAITNYAFERLGKSHVIALIRPENLPSQAVAHAIGMRPGRQIRYADLDHILFSLTCDKRVHPPRSNR